MDLQQIKEIFLTEAEDLLHEADEALLRLEKDPTLKQDIHTLFRVFHTIKGSAGMFGLDSIVEFTHEMENYLDKIRKGELALDLAKIDELFKAVDYLRNSIGQVFLGSSDKISSAENLSEQDKDKKIFKIKIEPKESLLISGFDPYSFIAYLKKLGQIQRVETNYHRLPHWQNFDSEKFYLDFEILLLSNSTKEEIYDVFDLMQTEAKIEIFEEKTFTKSQKEDLNQKQNLETALEKKYLRIDAKKVDELVNLVGEIVIAAAAIREHSSHIAHAELQEDVSVLGRLVELLRDNVMGVRMVQIGETFRRFERTVRDLAHDLGKKIQLVIQGKETELDKNLVENIVDPLIHLIRNAADHGIEMPEERKKLGKNETGTISLNAYHETGSVVIEISDDGRGIDKQKVLEKAIKLNLAERERVYTDKEIFDFLFEPGFSTKEEVSEISGRGVGMDVVKRNIEELKGSLEIETVLGMGTTFRIRLPLTLAIIDGFLVEVNSNYYVLPLDMVQECLELQKELMASGGNLLNLRGEVVPFIDLAEFFGEKSHLRYKKQAVVIVMYSRKKFGLVVDKLLGELQVVVKPLGRLLEGLPGLGGATILGGGEIGYILDVPKLLDHLTKKELNYGANADKQELLGFRG